MKFQPGQSGNPNGRAKGSINKRTQLAKLLEPHAEELIAKAVELALAGDGNALRLCIERLIPKAKPDTISFDLSTVDLESQHCLGAVGKEILVAVANGELNIKEAQTFSQMLESQRKLIEHGELKQMLKEIEETIKYKR